MHITHAALPQEIVRTYGIYDTLCRAVVFFVYTKCRNPKTEHRIESYLNISDYM
jgi:hypothetical protein